VSGAGVNYWKVHPRTALWWIEREQCRRCSFHRSDGHADACDHPRAIIGAGRARAGNGGATCISVRDEGGACGPAGRLFTERKGKA
jgi:hypothetical protein